MRVLLTMIAAGLLAGCAVSAKIDARNEYVQSGQRYKQCLVENGYTPQKCEGLRLALEADERRYNTLSAGLNGDQRADTVTVLQR
jgi:hypothetical protein